MHNYKVTFEVKHQNLPYKVKITCIHVVVEAMEEKDAKIMAKELLHPLVSAQIKKTSISRLS